MAQDGGEQRTTQQPSAPFLSPDNPMRIDSKKAVTRTLSAAAILLTAGCRDAASTLLAPDSPNMSRSANNCENLTVEGSAKLGFVEVAPGVFTLGALASPATIAGVSGMLSSVVTGLNPSGAKDQGAQHLTLIHFFNSEQGTFMTSDRAVCAPAGAEAGICRVNDVLSVVSGTGVFANAEGSIRNHGVINLIDNTISISLRGRVCGAGL